MTREEAIVNLNMISVAFVEPVTKEQRKLIDNTFDMAIKALEQEPKTGHWILDETDNSITCDKCGCLIWANDISNGEAYYCPNCGARMAESEDKE